MKSHLLCTDTFAWMPRHPYKTGTAVHGFCVHAVSIRTSQPNPHAKSPVFLPRYSQFHRTCQGKSKHSHPWVLLVSLIAFSLAFLAAILPLMAFSCSWIPTSFLASQSENKMDMIRAAKLEHVCMHVNMYVHMYACMHVCMYVSVCAYYVCMYVCKLLGLQLFTSQQRASQLTVVEEAICDACYQGSPPAKLKHIQMRNMSPIIPICHPSSQAYCWCRPSILRFCGV